MCPFWWYLLILRSLKLVAVNLVQTSCVLCLFSALKYIDESRIHTLSAVVAMVDGVSIWLLYYLSKCTSWKSKNLFSVLGSFYQFSSYACSDIEMYLRFFTVCMWTWQWYSSFQRFFCHLHSFTTCEEFHTAPFQVYVFFCAPYCLVANMKFFSCFK